ncbi:MFS transporter [Terriglobus sp. ADX1]|uniref:MFS transporter n=1 Tax=Terriglobus sp. ADX1 TaxID=2794063 RepID=UPI002FE5D4AC
MSTKGEEQSPPPLQGKTYPALGILGVLLGAMLATFLGRLISVGSADLRGAMHLDSDAASWVGTSYNMGLMFIGPFSVYLGGLLGPRRVLLSCAALFSLICVALPFCGLFSIFIALLVFAGLTAGTFYPLALSFVLRNLPLKYLVFGIGAYSLDIVVTTHVAHSYQAWMMHALSWRWIFWTDAALAPVMMLFVYFGIPGQPLPKPAPNQTKPSWLGFFYASLSMALIYGALDQGQRVDWWRSNLFVAMLVTGLFLGIAAAVRHFAQPNPLINFRFLGSGNTLLLGVTIMLFRFVLLATVVLVPSFLASAQGYSAEQTGPVLLWVAVPQVLVTLFAIILLARLDSRLILALGFALVASGCTVNAHLASSWSGNSFQITQLVLATGEAFAFTGLVGTIVLEAINSGALRRPIDVLTFAGFFQSIRLMGGEAGASFIQFFLQHRERIHSNALGLHVQTGGIATTQRLLPLSSAMLPYSSPDIAGARAGALLGLTIRSQAFTMAVADGFLVVAYTAAACLLVIACMGTLQLQYKQLSVQGVSPTK